MELRLSDEQYNQIKKEILSSQQDTVFEKNKLKAYLGKVNYELLKETKAIIAGGMIASLFTNKEINDVDIYFRDYNSLYLFSDNAIDEVSHIVSHTNKATQLLDYNENSERLLLQIIHYRTYATPEEIFKTYDFTVCMGAYDFALEEFVLHPDFLKHNSQRILRFNAATSYPLISAIRIQKYENKGYKISKAEYFRVILTCMQLDIKSYEDLKEHLGGMYGESYDRLFEDVKDEEFDLQAAVERIANFPKADCYLAEYHPGQYVKSEVLQDLDKGEKIVVKLKSGLYRIIENQLFKFSGDEKDCTLIDANEFYKDAKFYKLVCKQHGEYTSFYDSKFKYIIGKESSPEKLYEGGKHFNNKSTMLFFNRLEHITKSSFYGRDKAVLLELDVKGEDIIQDSTHEVTATKVKVVREVPENEWKEKVNSDVSTKGKKRTIFFLN